MPQTPGNNLPRFRDVQLAFAAHIRNPAQQPAPEDIEPRRMRIYVDLFYNNVERFLAATFPVTKHTLQDEGWHSLVRGFLREHRATSPYFQEIPQEFLEFLATRHALLATTPYLLELCHYEWVELAVAVSLDECPVEGVDPHGDLMAGVPVVSPLAWPLFYRFPVHRIGPHHRPAEAPAVGTHLIVYRNCSDQVKFMESNEVTARLLALLNEPAGNRTGAGTLAVVAAELGHPAPQAMLKHGRETLEALRTCDIIAGTRVTR